MPRKTSLYIDAAAEAVVQARDFAPRKVRRHGRRSSLFREFLRRYDAICRSDVPELEDDEWTVLIKAGQSWLDSDDVTTTHRLGSLIGAAGDSSKGLVTKLLDMQFARRMSVIDFIERYWSAKVRGVDLPVFPGRPEKIPVRKGRTKDQPPQSHG